MKRIHVPAWACAALAALVLAGCGGAAPQPAPASSSRPNTITVTVTNGTDYAFHELYVSPTATDDRGENQLAETLLKNRSRDIALESYEYGNYDVLVVNEEGDEYIFTYVSLAQGAEVRIFMEEQPGAQIYYADTTEEEVEGRFGAAPAQSGASSTGTGNDTNGAFRFTVHNKSEYDIYAIFMGIADALAEHDFDLLPEILPAGSSVEVDGVVSQGDWMNTEWTLNVMDVDGDWSAAFDLFNPWDVSYVNIEWDRAAGGYVCRFFY